MRGCPRLVLTCAVAAVLGVVATPPAAACACGGMAPPHGQQVFVADERAIVYRHEGRQRIELGLGVLADGAETGMIFPTPAPAEVALGSSATFEEIEAAIAPRMIVDSDWFGGGASTGSSGGTAAGGAPQAAAPQVLSQVQLGPVQATTLRADDSTGLDDWLEANGYGIRDEVSELLAGYVDRGWYFVALKLTSDDTLDGALDPIQFTFDSPDLVYPLDLSRAASTRQQVRLYVFDEHKAQPAALSDPTALLSTSFTHWAGAAPDEFDDRGDYLTVLDMWFDRPAVDIPGDLTLVRAADDLEVNGDYHVSRLVTFLGIPAGWAIVLGVLLAPVLALAIAHAADVVRDRRRFSNR